LRSAEIGLLASVGRVADIPIFETLKIGILSTGNELVAANTKDLPAGKIRDSNKVMLQSIMINQLGQTK
jgi:molybdopterin molybdotransferase